MPSTIPCRPDLTHYTLQAVLDGLTVTLRFRWNSREGAWYMDVLNEDESAAAVLGIKVVVAWPLGRRNANLRATLGLFTAFDTSGQDRDPGITDLGDRVQLIYYSREEVAAMREVGA